MSGFGDDDDDDMFDSHDEGDDESELSADGPSAPAPAQSTVRLSPERAQSTQSKGKRLLRIRPMTPKMRLKHPEAVSIAITRHDGRQLIFVR